MDVLTVTDRGLYCAAADAYIDPLQPVARALLTHAHADHARAGSDRYWAATPGVALLQRRLGGAAAITAVDYGEPFALGNARVSFHPAGHVLGSAQIRIAVGGSVWVVTGDFKRAADPTCAPFEPVRCDVLITEATFALPIYRWPEPETVFADIADWWRQNRDAGRASVLFAYALGKAQRVLAGLTRYADEPVLVHGAVEPLTVLYRDAGVAMLPTETIDLGRRANPERFAGRLIVAPPGARNSPWLRRFGRCATGFCSGWMQLRGRRRWRNVERGFVLSDHADWNALLQTVADSGARRVLVTHGQAGPLVRYLCEQGLDAAPLAGLARADDDAEGVEDAGHTSTPRNAPRASV